MWTAIQLAVGLAAGALHQDSGLDAVLRQVDRDYPKLTAYRQEVAAVRAKVREKRGAFDPVLSIGTDLLRYNSPTAPGKASEARQNEAIVEVVTPEGLKLGVGYRLNQGKVKSPLSMTGDLGEAFVQLKVPLIRNRGVNDKSIGLAQAALAAEVAEWNFSAFRLDTLEAAAAVYWEYVAARQKKQVAQDLLRLAAERAEALQLRFQAGDLPEVETVEAMTEVKRREGALAKADRDLAKAQLKLELYTGGQSPATSSLPTLPLELDDTGARSWVDTALAQRPELKAAQPLRRSLDAQLRLARNDRMPGLELTLSPGWDSGASGIGATSKIGLLYSAPLRQNTADGRIEETQAKLAKLQADLTLLSQAVQNEVADAVSAVRTSAVRVKAAEQELALARRLEQAERDRFAIGEGTLFLLNQRERGTAEAAVRWIEVLAEHQQAWVALRAAAGVL